MLQEKYTTTIRPALQEELKVANEMIVPRLEKIVVSMGVGRFKDNDAYIQDAKEELRQITGQAPTVRRSRLSIAAFKLRQGEIVGLQVTLRGQKMWDFLERMIHTALPRVRDFRGLSTKSFDGQGNYSMGILEHQVFPEIDPAKMKHVKSLQVTIVTPPSVDDDGALRLLTHLGMPFEKE